MNIVILAAGQGKRMGSDLPKVLHTIAGKALVLHVIETARQLQKEAQKLCVVVGHGAAEVQTKLAASDLVFALQEQQLGTGHAVKQAIPHLEKDKITLILYGDVPLTSLKTLEKLVAAAKTQNALAILTVNLENPTGYGRICRAKNGKIVSIIEHKDADAATRQIKEINTGIMALPTIHLEKWLNNLSTNNAQKEYYLTDIVHMAVKENVAITSEQPDFSWEVEGVNTKVQLAELERVYQKNSALQLLAKGVHLADLNRFDVRGNLSCGRDVFIDVNCVFEGQVFLGDNVHIAPNCVIKNATIGANVRVEAFSHIEEAVIGASAKIGPFARLRPGANLCENTHIGNFVEIKKSVVGKNSKVNHLAYIGDATIGERVNVGAGTITCNYDGVNKFQTIIEDDAFIGSDTQLVAPVTVKKGATLGAGTTLTKDAPENALTISRAKQMTIASWKRPEKVKKM